VFDGERRDVKRLVLGVEAGEGWTDAEWPEQGLDVGLWGLLPIPGRHLVGLSPKSRLPAFFCLFPLRHVPAPHSVWFATGIVAQPNGRTDQVKVVSSRLRRSQDAQPLCHFVIIDDCIETYCLVRRILAELFRSDKYGPPRCVVAMTCPL
jgi:hypothetical protein